MDLYHVNHYKIYILKRYNLQWSRLTIDAMLNFLTLPMPYVVSMP